MSTVRLHSRLVSVLLLAFVVAVPVFAQSASENKTQAKKSEAQTSKKKKKKKASAVYYVPGYVVQSQQRAASAPTLQRIDVTPLLDQTTPAVVPRRPVTAAKSGKIRITPSGVPGPIAAGQLLISEFRVRGPSGANDEFIEIYNASGFELTVAATSGTGLGVAASDGVTRCTIPDGTIIPNRGHYLCTNSAAYSLSGNAIGDATYTTDIPDNAGIALFNNNTGGAEYTLDNRLDAVGSTSEANTLYKEGAGYPALTPFSIDYSFYRDNCGKSGSITTFGPCSTDFPVDTDNNATDFVFVDTNGTSAGAGQRLGAPGPENLNSPRQRNSEVPSALVAPCVAATVSPNRARDFTSDPANNSTFGTLSIRRVFTNNTGADISRLRFRVVDLTTFPAPSGFADLRPRTSIASTETNPDCNGGGSVSFDGLTLEQPPSQPNGGGFNSTLSAGTITLGSVLPPGGTITVNFLLGIQQTGSFKFYVNVEALEGVISTE